MSNIQFFKTGMGTRMGMYLPIPYSFSYPTHIIIKISLFYSIFFSFVHFFRNLILALFNFLNYFFKLDSLNK